MRKSRRKVCAIFIYAHILIGINFIPNFAMAQSLLQSWSDEPQISFEFYHPNIKEHGIGKVSGIAFLDIKYPVGNNTLLSFDIPYSYYKGTQFYSNYRAGSFGNPYVGLVFYNPDTPVTIDFGVRLPLISKIDYNLPAIANVTSFYRYDSMLKGFTSLNFRANINRNIFPFLKLKYYIGGIITTNFQSTLAPNIIAPFGFSLRYFYQQILFGGGITGLLNVRYLDNSLANSTMFQFHVESGLNLKAWSPNLYFAVPLDKEAGNLFSWIIGFRVTLKLHNFLK